jgi:hypothetical protein
MQGAQPSVTLPEGCWVAGGAIRRWFTGETQESDIDVFCESPEAEELIAKENRLSGVQRLKHGEQSTNFKGSPIQIIHNPRFVSPEDTIAHFDFALCQFFWDGSRIGATIEAILSTTRKRLAVAKIQGGYEIDSLRRAFKYARAGYWPCVGTIRELAKALNGAQDVSKFNEISPTRWD